MIHKVITKKYMPGNPMFAGRLVHPSPHIKIHPYLTLWLPASRSQPVLSGFAGVTRKCGRFRTCLRPVGRPIGPTGLIGRQGNGLGLLESGVIATFGSGDEEEYYTDGPTLEPPDGS